jgi:uncharacterized membrane protein
VRRALTPRPLKKARVRRAAMEQFLATDLHVTRDRTGVLIFAALAEHRVEVIADEGIYAAAPNTVWDEVVADLVSGLKRRRSPTASSPPWPAPAPSWPPTSRRAPTTATSCPTA